MRGCFSLTFLEQSLKPWHRMGLIVLLRLQQIVCCPALATMPRAKFLQAEEDDVKEDPDPPIDIKVPAAKIERRKAVDVSNFAGGESVRR